MPKPSFISNLKIPVIQAPMFLVSGPKMVIAACNSGIVGTFPALNPRTETQLDEWLCQIKQSISKESTYGVNLIVHKTNKRLEGNIAELVKHKVPLVITSLGAVKDVVDEVHKYGGLVFHDVTNVVHARKAIQAGVDGLIAVSSGAGGHAGLCSPFALIPQLRKEFGNEIFICNAGAISTGAGVLASRALGADLAYLGTRFIPTFESEAQSEYKQMLVDSKTGPAPNFLPTIYTDKISGVYANFLIDSVKQHTGSVGEKVVEDFSNLDSSLKWKKIWSAGHGTLNIHDISSVHDVVDTLYAEFNQAKLNIQ